MRTYRFLLTMLILVIGATATASAQKYSLKNTTNYEVVMIRTGSDGSKTFKIYVKEKNEKRALALAKEAAVQVCIFRGLPSSGSISGTPALCGNAALHEHESFFEDFFSPGGQYLKYVNVTSEGTITKADKMKVKGGYKIGVTVQVLYNNLREDLQEAGIIRSLSSGF